MLPAKQAHSPLNREGMKRKFLIFTSMAAAAIAATAEPVLTLDQALTQALERSPVARIATHRVAAAQAMLDQANAAIWPRMELRTSYRRTDQPMQAFGSILNQRAFSPSLNFNAVPEVDDWNLRGMVSLPLYAGGRIESGRTTARSGREQARLQAAAATELLAFRIVRGFHTLTEKRRFVEAADSAVAALESDHGVATKRLSEGTLLRADLLDVDVRLAQAREDRLRARNGAALALRALRNLVGVESGDFAPPPVAPDDREAEGMDVSNRPELLAMLAEERAAEAQVRGAGSGFKPQVNAFGSVDYDRGWRISGDGAGYTAGVEARWDLWDGNATRGKVREARARLDIVREERRQLRLALELELEQARLDLLAAREGLEVSAKMVGQAAESASLTRQRFEQGLALTAQVLDAEAAHLRSRVLRAQVESDHQVALAALRHALGLPQRAMKPATRGVL